MDLLVIFFTTDKDNLSDAVKNIEKNTNVTIAELYDLSNMSDKDRTNKMDYISLMNENMSLLKEELYNS